MRNYMKIEILSYDSQNNSEEEIINPLTNSACTDTFINSGELIIFFANMLINKEKYLNFGSLLAYEFKKQEPQEYLRMIQNDVTKCHGELIAKVILIDTYNLFLIRPTKFDVKALSDLLIKDLINTCKKAYSYVCMLTGENNNLKKDDEQNLDSDFAKTLSEIILGINYDVKPVLINGKLNFIDKYIMDTSMSAIKFDFISVLKNNKVIKKCKNCGSFFIPTFRSDEIYCDNIFKNNKTCKQIGYEMKINKDEYMKAYRTAYKTKNAFKNRNLKNNPNAEDQFINWVIQAKAKLIEAQAGKITLDEFKNWLKG